MALVPIWSTVQQVHWDEGTLRSTSGWWVARPAARVRTQPSVANRPAPTGRNVRSLHGIRWMAAAHGRRSGHPVTTAWLLTQKSVSFCVRKPIETSEKNMKTRWLVVSAAMVEVAVHSEPHQGSRQSSYRCLCPQVPQGSCGHQTVRGRGAAGNRCGCARSRGPWHRTSLRLQTPRPRESAQPALECRSGWQRVCPDNDQDKDNHHRKTAVTHHIHCRKVKKNAQKERCACQDTNPRAIVHPVRGLCGDDDRDRPDRKEESPGLSKTPGPDPDRLPVTRRTRSTSAARR